MATLYKSYFSSIGLLRTVIPIFILLILDGGTLFAQASNAGGVKSTQSVQNAEFSKNQTKGNRENFLRLTHQYGTLLRRKGPFILETNEKGYNFKNTFAINLEYGWQTKGDNEWESISNFPRFGVGLQKLFFLHRNELGNPFSFYGFFNGNFIRKKRFQWMHQIGAGLAFGFQTYDPTQVPVNDLISSKVNAYIEAGTSFSFLIGQRLSIEPGFRLTHFSNGNSRKPQKGINIFAYQLGIRYNLAKEIKDFIIYEKPPCQQRHEIFTSIGFGSRQVDFNESDHSQLPENYGFKYLMSNLTLGYNYKWRHQLKIGGGLDFYYDGTNGADIISINGEIEKNAIPFSQKRGVSGYLGIELVADRFSVAINANYQLVQYRFAGSTPKFQQRIGVKYYFLPNIFGGVDINAFKFHVAKSVQFKVGMRKYL